MIPALTIVFCGGLAQQAHGGFVSTLAGLGANDAVVWSSVGGSVGLAHASPWQVLSNSGITVTLTETGTFATAEQAPGGSWVGHFAANAIVLNDQFPNSAVTIGFSSPVQGFGTSIDSAFGGSFTGTIQAFNGGNSLGTYGPNAQNNALLFLGVLDATADITSVVITTNASNYFAASDFALVDAVSTAPSSGVPEPSSIVLAVGGLAGLTILRRRSVRS